MIASYSEYLKKQALLDSGDLSPEVRAKVQAAADEFKTKYLGDGTADMPLKPEDGAALINEAKAPGLPTQDEAAQRLVQRLNPGLSLPAQALATSPATTHPQGDAAAKDEWLRGDIGNPNGKVIVYETPAATVREELAKNPAIFGALQMPPMTPEQLANIKSGDSTWQLYNDWKWRETANAAAKAGKTAYRYSKAPYLGGDQAGLLDSLSTKLKSAALPGIESLTAFVMGADDTANFGAANAASDAGLLDDDKPGAGELAARAALETRKHAVTDGHFIGGGNDEAVGGSYALDPNASTRESNDSLREEYSGMHTAGQVAGALPGLVGGAAKLAVRGAEKLAAKGAETAAGKAVRSGIAALEEWNPSNMLWDTVMGKPATTAAGAAGKVLRGAVAGAANQAVSEGVRGGANYAATGETGTTLPEVGGRLKGAAAGGAVGGALHGALQNFGGKVRDHDGFYKGLPGDVEKLNGGKVYPLVGHATPKVVTEARANARAREMPVAPIDVFAEDLEKPLAGAAKVHEAGERKRVGSENREFEGTAEGREPLPATELAGTAYEKLKQRVAPTRRGLAPVGTPTADRPIKGVFNANIDGISVKPVEGWIKMPVSHAQAMLSPTMRMRAQRAARAPERPVMRAGHGLAGRPAPIARAEGEGAGGLDHRGYRTTPLRSLPSGERALPSGEETRLAKVNPNPGPRNAPPRRLGSSGTRFQDEGPQHEPFLEPKYPGAPHPELGASDTRFEREPRYDIERTRAAGSVARGARPATAGERAGATGARTHEVGPRGEPPPGPKAPGIRAEPAADYEPPGIPDAKFTQPRKRAQFKPKDAPSRTTRAEPATAEGKARREAADPQTFLTEMRKRGIKHVYVAPRRYSAMHQESAIRQVRRKGGENINDRDLQDLYHAALRDRDARPMNGKPGGWSELQQGHQRDIRAAKGTRKRVGLDEDAAYQSVVNMSTPKVGQSKDLRALSETAKRAGGDTLEKLRGARVMPMLTQLQRTSGFGKDLHRMRFGPSAFIDAGVLRGLYPVTRALENVNIGRGALVHKDAEEKKRRRARDDKHRAESEAKGAHSEKRETKPHKPRRRIE